MSDNTGKHLVEISRYGSTYYRGVVQSETEHTYMVLNQYERRPRRAMKNASDVLLPADADVGNHIAAYEKAFNSFRTELQAAEDAVRAITDKRRAASIEALLRGSHD